MTLPTPKPGQPALTGAAAPVPTTVWITPKSTPTPTFGIHQAARDSTKNEKRAKQLLGEMYADKEYLVRLEGDRGIFYNTRLNLTRQRLC